MTEDLGWIPAQTYAMGSDRHYPEERPSHRVSVDGFWIETHQVANAQSRHLSTQPVMSRSRSDH